MIGGIAGFYLYLLAVNSEPGMRGRIFGFGYGAATFMNWGYSALTQGLSPHMKLLTDGVICLGIILLVKAEHTLMYSERDESRMQKAQGTDREVLFTYAGAASRFKQSVPGKAVSEMDCL